MCKFFMDAVEKKEKIMIYYLDGNGNLTQRIIRTIRIKDGRLLAFCYYRRHVRSFMLNNILSWSKVEQKAGA